MEDQDIDPFRKYFVDCRTEKSHFVNTEHLRMICFNIINAFYAHEMILKGNDPEEENGLSSEWQKNFHNYISAYLLELSIGLRAIEETSEFSSQLSVQDHEGFWGMDEDIKNKTIKEACSKIIHAKRITYSLCDLDTADEDLIAHDDFYAPPGKCMSGEIELQGEKNSKEWCISIYIQDFITSALKLINLCERDEKSESSGH